MGSITLCHKSQIKQMQADRRKRNKGLLSNYFQKSIKLQGGGVGVVCFAFVLAVKYLNGPKILHILKAGFICMGEMDAVDTSSKKGNRGQTAPLVEAVGLCGLHGWGWCLHGC